MDLQGWTEALGLINTEQNAGKTLRSEGEESIVWDTSLPGVKHRDILFNDIVKNSDFLVWPRTLACFTMAATKSTHEGWNDEQAQIKSLA